MSGSASTNVSELDLTSAGPTPRGDVGAGKRVGSHSLPIPVFCHLNSLSQCRYGFRSGNSAIHQATGLSVGRRKRSSENVLPFMA